MTSTVPHMSPSALRGRALLLLLVMCGAIFLEGVDIAMFSVALPSVRADLGMDVTELQWVLTAYVLGYGGFLLVGGRVADTWGRRRVFLGSLAIFLVFSGFGSLSTEPWMLLVARAITGVAAAFMAPAGLSILTTSFEGRARERAVLIYSGVAAGGFTLGLVLGGVLTMFGWRWVFVAPAFFSALLLVVSVALVPKDGASPASRVRIGVLNGAVLTVSLIVLIAAIERAAHVPVAVTVAMAALSALLLGMFALLERRSADPLLPSAVLRDPAVLRAGAQAGLFSAAFFGFQFAVVLALQEELGWGVLETSLALLAIGIDVVLAPTVTPRLVRRFGVQPVLTVGLALGVIAYFLFVPFGPEWTYLAMLPSFLVLGAAFTLAYGPLTIAATQHVSDEQQGVAGGVLYTAFQFGGAIGLAIVSFVLTAAPGAGQQYGIAAATCAALALLALVMSAIRGRRSGVA